jgi:hypothetical protein
MAIIYAAALKTTRMTAVETALDAGAGAATLVIGTAALSGATGVLATVPLADPAGTVSGAVLTFSGMPKSAAASASGTAAKAELRDSGGTVVASGLTVGTSGTDIIINSVTISIGQTIQINSGSITHG